LPSFSVSGIRSTTKKAGIGNAMWIIIRTLKGKNSFLTGSREWSQDRNEAERFDEFHYAVNCRDKEIAPSERRGVGVVKFG
jgi:hypothetical protein